MRRPAAASDFWDHVAPLLAAGAAEQGTVMGGPCLRVLGKFLAMPNHRGPGLIVKLPAGLLAALISEGAGEPFAPARRVFKEWVLVPRYDAALWDALLGEARQFAIGVTA